MSERPGRRRAAPAPPPAPPLRPAGRRPPEQLSLLEDPDASERTHRTSGSHGAVRRPRGPRFGEQFDLFPPKVEVVALDPRALLGTRTRVAGLWRVTLGPGDVHVVFRDRHGLYCEAHGVGCRAVGAVGAA